MLDALKAVEKLNQLNKRIEALDSAYKELWQVFDNRWMALELNKIQTELEEERSNISSKLREINI